MLKQACNRPSDKNSVPSFPNNKLATHVFGTRLGRQTLVIQARSIPYKRSRHFPATTAGGVEMKAQGLPKIACFGKPFLENAGHPISLAPQTTSRPPCKTITHSIVKQRKP
ncbi:hypothetical protein [Crenothrix polyspora]|uniref:hypothetical protein n=1 Tax=Crenothrix polyspora TaxID=360316 RepID=UPI001121CA33|nr:hypothetical protein [Crenothrix polyspora]